MFISRCTSEEKLPNTTTINPPTRLTNTTNINFDKILNAIFLSAFSALRSHSTCIHKSNKISKAKPQAFGYEREYFEYNLFSLISPHSCEQTATHSLPYTADCEEKWQKIKFPLLWYNICPRPTAGVERFFAALGRARAGVAEASYGI